MHQQKAYRISWLQEQRLLMGKYRMPEDLCICECGCGSNRIIYKCRAASQKVGGGGIRYTVLICGKESYLFQEGNKWFVEAKENRN